MTPRHLQTAAALQGFMAWPDPTDSERRALQQAAGVTATDHTEVVLAKIAVCIADATLAELARTEPQPAWRYLNDDQWNEVVRYSALQWANLEKPTMDQVEFGRQALQRRFCEINNLPSPQER